MRMTLHLVSAEESLVDRSLVVVAPQKFTSLPPPKPALPSRLTTAPVTCDLAGLV